MADYTRAYLRPDGRASLIGDSDSGQILPIVKREGDDHAYVLALAAAESREARFKVSAKTPQEVLWILGEQGVREYDSLTAPPPGHSQAFTEAGIYVLRHDDLYLLFNVSGCGLNGRGSHGHNDALSIEVSACGTPFIVDPGSYVYTADLRARHMFRSTAYHSTVQVDGVEQNTSDEQLPFVMGDEARPRAVSFETNDEFDFVVAEHDGYQRLDSPVTHRRAVRFDKRNRFWLIDDEFRGADAHEVVIRFHLNAGLKINAYNGAAALAHDPNSGARLLIQPLELKQRPHFEEQFVSRDYGEKQSSVTASWTLEASMPTKLRWLLLPLCGNEDERERLAPIQKLLK